MFEAGNNLSNCGGNVDDNLSPLLELLFPRNSRL